MIDVPTGGSMRDARRGCLKSHLRHARFFTRRMPVSFRGLRLSVNVQDLAGGFDESDGNAENQRSRHLRRVAGTLFVFVGTKSVGKVLLISCSLVVILCPRHAQCCKP